MSLRIGLVTVTHSRPDLCEQMIESALASNESSLISQIMVFDSSPGGIGMTKGTCCIVQGAGPQMNRRGLANHWNRGVDALYNGQYACDAVIITNDDILFGPGDLEKLAIETAKHTSTEVDMKTRGIIIGDDGRRSRAVHVITCRGIQNRTSDGKVNPHEDTIHYSCFGITKAGWSELGAFDENFFPAYFEDCDYSYRAKLAGMREVNIGMTGIVHLGSQTANPDDPSVYNAALYEQNNRTFHANKAYYARKWGGPNDHEVFTTPFNIPRTHLQYEDRPWFIQPSRSDIPYGFPYDREEAERKQLVSL